MKKYIHKSLANLIEKYASWNRDRLTEKMREFFESKQYKVTRDIFRPAVEAQQEAFNKTVYCGNTHCTLSTLYHKKSADTGSLVSRCNSAFSRCHTIPKGSQLKDIASDDHEVIWIPMPPAEHTSSRPKPYWTKGRLDEILTFRGFCSTCDNDLFLPIDEPFEELDHEKCFLLAFRAFSYSLWRNEVQTNATQHLLPKYLKKHAKKNKNLPPLKSPDSDRENLMRTMHQNKRNQYLSIQNRFVESIADGTHLGLTSLVLFLDHDVPIRYSCAVPLTSDFRGKSINVSWERSVEIPYVYVSLIKVGQGSALIFSYFDNVPNEAGKQYFDSVFSSMDKKTLVRDFHHFAVINNMGFVSNPGWFAKIPKSSLFLLSDSLSQGAYGKNSSKRFSLRKIYSRLHFMFGKRFGVWDVKSFDIVNSFDSEAKDRLANAVRIAKEDNSLDFQATAIEEEWLPKIFHGKAALLKYCFEKSDMKMALFYAIEMVKISQRLKNAQVESVPLNEGWKYLLIVAACLKDEESIQVCEEVLSEDH